MNFPDVPNVPGVPPLLRDPLADPATVVQLLTGDVVGLISSLNAPQWGLFQNGDPVVTSDSVVTMEYKQDWAVADFPIEQGSFASYDKVDLPYDVKFRFACGGSISDRQTFLDSIAAIAGTLDVYDGVTPEEVYPNLNVTHYDYSRSNSNVGLLIVDVWCIQIRDDVTQSFSNTQAPSGADPVSNGTVQPTPATPQLQSALSSIL